MTDHDSVNQRRFANEYDEKVDSDDDDVEVGPYHDDDSEEKAPEGDIGHNRSYLGDGESLVASSVCDDLAYERGRDAGSEDALDAGITLSEQEEQRLLGAFLLAVDGGLDGGAGSVPGVGEEEVQLPTDGPSCLRKFTTIAASLGLKTTRDQLREDFERVVRYNGLVESTLAHPWQGAHDTEGVINGFTYKVFRRYYLAKIQGELLETNIRQAWNDLHYGTGGKRMSLESSGKVGLSTAAASQQHHDADQPSSGGRPYVTRAELQKILTREGEALTDEEVDELLRECRPDDEGRIVYEGYRRMLIDPSL